MANGWNVLQKASFSEDISSTKLYHYMVRTEGERVIESINGINVIGTQNATSYKKGGISMQADQNETVIDNIKISIPVEKLPVKPGYAQVYQPQVNMNIAPSVIAEVKKASDITDYMAVDAKPSTLILYIDKNLNVLDENQAVIGSVQDVYESLNEKIMPAFYVKDADTVDSLCTFIKNLSLEDAFVISDDGNLIKAVRTKCPIIRGIVSFKAKSGLSQNDAMDIIKTTNSSLSKIAVIPQSAATHEIVEYMQKRLITVWIKADDSLIDMESIHNVIYTGANGIITNQTTSYFDAYRVFKDGTAIIRKPWNIGHRGVASLAPENTMEGLELAYKLGADMVENDLYLTADNQIVVMHDNQLDRTTNGTGSIESYTLAQLKQLKANKGWENKYPHAKIPTLAEYFEFCKGKDITIVNEIKSEKPEIIDALTNLIHQYDIEDQCVVISFHSTQITRLVQKVPTLSTGILTNSITSESNIPGSLNSVLALVQSCNSVYDGSYPNMGPLFAAAAAQRGLSLWLWTVDDSSAIKNYISYGINGITTNRTQDLSNFADELTPVSDVYNLVVGKAAKIKAKIKTYNDTVTEKAVEIVPLEKKDQLIIDGLNITAKASGNYKVLLRCRFDENDDKYYLYSKAVTLHVDFLPLFFKS